MTLRELPFGARQQPLFYRIHFVSRAPKGFFPVDCIGGARYSTMISAFCPYLRGRFFAGNRGGTTVSIYRPLLYSAEGVFVILCTKRRLLK